MWFGLIQFIISIRLFFTGYRPKNGTFFGITFVVSGKDKAKLFPLFRVWLSPVDRLGPKLGIGFQFNTIELLSMKRPAKEKHTRKSFLFCFFNRPKIIFFNNIKQRTSPNMKGSKESEEFDKGGVYIVAITDVMVDR